MKPWALLISIFICSVGWCEFESELIFPAEPLHNHSPGFVETPEGDLIACWFHGHGEKSDDTLVIQGARKERGADHWSEPFLLADNRDLPDQNPVLFIDAKNKLWLFWISSLDNTSRTYLLKYRTSTDYEGEGPPKWDWQDVLICRPQGLEEAIADTASKVDKKFGESFDSEPKYRGRLEEAGKLAKEKLWRRLGWMPRCSPIMLDETRMMIGLYSDIFLCSIAAFTEDGGESWEFSHPTLGYGGIQPSLVQKKNGDIVAMMRDKSPAKRIRRSLSTDGGMTWSDTGEMEIPNPDSSVSAEVLDNGHWVLVCNDTTGGDRGGRTRLVIFLSEDEGETWPIRKVIEDHDKTCAAAYPTVRQTRDGIIHCVYTHSPSPNETIKHIWFDEDWIREEGK
ncbi:MAG: exo-alpha-sialidase [Candidatus Omnitrophica bacterium]|nr:exo-alpha-sialidase [Candidatus Omnitrophota bacterium]